MVNNIAELPVATLFAWVFVVRHQMSCRRFLCFSSQLTCGLLKNHRNPQQQKASLNRRTGVCTCRGDSVSPNTSNMIQKWTINITLAMSNQADQGHRYEFHILQWICSTKYFTILFWDWGRRRIARINSQRYSNTHWQSYHQWKNRSHFARWL
jgi:hypothetical protein